MNRRKIIKNTILAAGLGAITPLNLLAGKSKNIPAGNSPDGGFKKITLGGSEIFILTDGYLTDKPATFAPRANVEEEKNILRNNFRSAEIIEMAMNVPLIKLPGRLILLDTGMGFFADENTGKLLDSLHLAGFSPHDITDIFISHAHPDHIGGVVNKNNERVFPQAKIFISKIEHDFWMQASLKDFNNSALKNQPAFLNMFIPAVQKILDTIQPQLNFYDLDEPLYGHFNFQLAAGHTPGMTLTEISSGNEKLLYVADLIHSDVILFEHPEWGFSGDTDLDIAIATRIKVLNQLADKRMGALAYHLTWPGLGYVKKLQTENRFEWIQKSFVTP